MEIISMRSKNNCSLGTPKLSFRYFELQIQLNFIKPVDGYQNYDLKTWFILSDFIKFKNYLSKKKVFIENLIVI